MMAFDASTTRLTDEKIERSAAALRTDLGFSDSDFFNMAEVFEVGLPKLRGDFTLTIATVDEMSHLEAYVTYDPPTVVVRADIFNRARENDPRSRLTLAHELGHLELHSGGIFPRSATDGQRLRSIPALESTEGQAFRFGACFLMPKNLALQIRNAAVLARQCGVSVQAAQFRINDVERQLQRENVAKGFQDLLSWLRAQE
jgi:hypothetical protein